MSKREELMERAEEAIDAAFNDLSAVPSESVSRGRELQSHIQSNIDALKECYDEELE